MSRSIAGDEVIYTAEGRVNTKIKRIQRYRDQIDESTLPDSYNSNSTREELCLEYVHSFLDQFASIYPKRKKLYIIAENECGVSKIVCTTVRPSLLPYSELYDYTECASFLAGFVHYEPLDPIGSPPLLLISPNITLEQYSGDSYDIAVLLCSFLLGAGYDAYVVNGYAPRSITLRDQSRTQAPLSKTVMDSSTLESICFEGENDDNPYIPIDNSLRSSTYLANEEERERFASLDSFMLWINKDVVIDEDLTVEGEARAHAWVMIAAGSRDVKENIFVEPTTGRSYPVKSSPYLGIESLWNHENYWVNLKIETQLSQMDYDLSNNMIWEFVFISLSGVGETGEDRKVSDEDRLIKDEVGTDDVEILHSDDVTFDCPPTWSNVLRLERQAYLLRFPPNGHRTVLYCKSKVDLFAKNLQPDGIVMRIVSYHDERKVIVSEIHEWFENRKDRMYKRSRYNLGKTKQVEYYHPGSLGEVKQWNEYPGKRRDVYFHVDGRLDRLYRREEIIGEKISEYYEGRTDYMLFRSVLMTTDENIAGGRKQFSLSGGGLTDTLFVLKIMTVFDRNPTVRAENDVARRIFSINEGKLTSHFHFLQGKMTRTTKVLNHTRTMGDKHSDDEINEEDIDALQEATSLERDTFAQVKETFRQLSIVCINRDDTEANVMKERTIFEVALDKVDYKEGVEINATVATTAVDSFGSDYLTPFLRNLKEPNNLSREDAMDIRQTCLDSLKARLVERANIIQSRLNEENSKLARKQEQFTRAQRDGEMSNEEYEKYCTEAMFRISILEKRLVEHEETALKKFADLDNKLSQDPRLKVLKAQMI